MTNYDDSKIFLRHKTKLSTDDDGKSFLVCGVCGRNIKRFQEILSQHKLKIFPLFINPDEVTEEIKIIKGDLDEDKNTFAFVFDNIKPRIKRDIYDFYLVVMSGDYFFFDYVTGYKWELGNFIQLFGKENNQYPINRRGLEIKICNVLTGNERLDYFNTGKDNKQIKKLKDNQLATLIYSLRQKIFDFVYRNQNNLTSKDLISIIVFRIEKDIKNDSARNSQCREFLNLFFNKHLLEGTKMDNEKILLNKVKPMRDIIISGKSDSFEIREDDEWAYWAGQIAYYLVSLSKSDDKNYGLLESFTNKSTTNLVKKTIRELFEKYKHAISLANQRFKTVIRNVLAYELNKSFMDLKIPFYVGAFDDNTIYMTKEKQEMVEVA